jgi:hypothetical protein
MSLKGFPHSEIPGSKLVCSSPGLIAAYRVLHRLLAPRHSPYALSSLTTSVWTHADCPLGLRLETNPHETSLLTLRPAFARDASFGERYVRKELPFAGYSVVKELPAFAADAARRGRLHIAVPPQNFFDQAAPSLPSRSSLTHTSEGWWRIPGSNR